MRSYAVVGLATVLLTLTSYTHDAHAQAAGAGAAYNKADRAATAREAEQQRIHKADKPIQPDPLGNSVIGGVVTGTMRGAAAGAASAVRSGAIGSAAQEIKQDIQKNKEENLRTGRGGPNDPRYNPGTLLNR